MKAASLLQRALRISPEGFRPAPVPEQFSPVAGDTLQIWPTGFSLRLSIVMLRFQPDVQCFFGEYLVLRPEILPLREGARQLQPVNSPRLREHRLLKCSVQAAR